MNNKSFEKIVEFLKNDIGLDESTISLGIKLANKNNTLLPVSMWSYGLIDCYELNKFYKFLYQN
tara:strand:+ start:1026 stop:1217 length:192 start_codon:yes stop_codon:yes gene_type:complete